MTKKRIKCGLKNQTPVIDGEFPADIKVKSLNYESFNMSHKFSGRGKFLDIEFWNIDIEH